MTRRPALTDAVVAGLEEIYAIVVPVYEDMTRDDPQSRAAGQVQSVKRGIDYLAALTFWHWERKESER